MVKWLGTLVLVVAALAGAAYYWLFRPQAERLAQSRWKAEQCAVENRHLETALSRKLLTGEIGDHTRVTVDTQDGAFVFSSAPLARRKEKEPV